MIYLSTSFYSDLRINLWHIEGILTPEQERDGFQLLEDEHLVYVKRFGKVCCTLDSGIKRESIWKVVESIRNSQEP